MSWDSDFLEMMPHTVVVYARASHNSYGEPTYSTSGSTYRARVANKPGMLRNLRGEFTEFFQVAWVASTGTINVNDKVTLPDGTSPELANVERNPDEDGVYINKLYFKHSGGIAVPPRM